MAITFFSNWRQLTHGFVAEFVIVDARLMADDGMVGFSAALLGVGFVIYFRV